MENGVYFRLFGKEYLLSWKLLPATSISTNAGRFLSIKLAAVLIVMNFGARFRVKLLLSVKTHRRVATGNTKSWEVAGALAGTAPRSTARNLAHAFVSRVAGRAT